MFSRQSSKSSLEIPRNSAKIIKLVKDPLHMDWIEVHVHHGHENLAYLVMQTTESGKLSFYAKGVFVTIESNELTSLFKEVQKGWARIATPEQHTYMIEKSEHLSSFLSVPEESTDSEENSYLSSKDFNKFPL